MYQKKLEEQNVSFKSNNAKSKKFNKENVQVLDKLPYQTNIENGNGVINSEHNLRYENEVNNTHYNDEKRVEDLKDDFKTNPNQIVNINDHLNNSVYEKDQIDVIKIS